MHSELVNIDCMEYMRQFPDKFFDLACVDTPYGIGESGKTNKSRSKMAKAKDYGNKNWDEQSPNEDYFKELIRVSKKQIIWGANHFISKIPFDSSCWIVWDKDNSGDFADCELAWTSFDTAVRKFKWRWNGMLQQDMKHKEERVHPTQKPVALYRWIFRNYAEPGFKILDTHLGSGSSRIAAHDMKCDFWSCEIDPEYVKKSEKRFNQYISAPMLNY